ncbi:hypothetical protein GCK32_018171 [Trichostrongylus colubriformis]|uniref:Uncharacterized protein n=1 Tax=Trichostrongylus colubriformis TaxID=6319 RepID=A0AAN8IH07_TRICO
MSPTLATHDITVFYHKKQLQCEQLKESEHFSFEFGENSEKTMELQSKLSEMKEESAQLEKKVKEKRANSTTQSSKIEVLRQSAESNKLAKERELKDAEGEVSGFEAEAMRLEAEAEDLQNKKYELEGEVHLIKHQLSTKTEELAAAKENFCHMQVAAQAVSTELTSNHKGVTTELQKATEKKVVQANIYSYHKSTVNNRLSVSVDVCVCVCI